MQNVIIEDRYIEEILSVIGYPLLTIDDLELDEDQLKSLVIIPTLREYYKFFPIVEYGSYSVLGSFEIDFPSVEVFNITDARLNTMGSFPATRTSNPFANNLLYRQGNYGMGGVYGTGNTYGMENALVLERSTRQSAVEYNKAFKVSVDLGNRKVIGYSNTSGKLMIGFCKYSEIFANVPFSRMNEVLDLAKSKLLDVIVRIRSQQTTGLPDEWNFGVFQDIADELKTAVMDSWKSHTKVVLMN